jgi:hypothetical protein
LTNSSKGNFLTRSTSAQGLQRITSVTIAESKEIQLLPHHTCIHCDLDDVECLACRGAVPKCTQIWLADSQSFRVHRRSKTQELRPKDRDYFIRIFAWLYRPAAPTLGDLECIIYAENSHDRVRHVAHDGAPFPVIKLRGCGYCSAVASQLREIPRSSHEVRRRVAQSAGPMPSQNFYASTDSD